MPIARSATLWAHVLTSLVANLVSLTLVVLVALPMGFRSGAGPLAWLEVLGILVLFTLALTWLAVIAGLAAKSTDGAGGFAYPLLFLPFLSSAFVPTDGMPGPVRWFAEHQPVTSIVDTLRDLFAQQPLGNDVWTALGWCAGSAGPRLHALAMRRLPAQNEAHADDQPARGVRRSDGARGPALPRQGPAAGAGA